MENLNELYVIPSGKPKIWDHKPELGSVKACEAYTGTFHRLLQQYVEMINVHWVIISPKYGILNPDEFVPETYNLSFSMKKNPDVISVERMSQQLSEKGLSDAKRVVMLGGKKFKPIMEQLFPQASLHYPLHGSKGIGAMQKSLKDAINNKRML
ncbi:hypothetical protein GCM10008986_11980 [Salinibacillus aidingensis]|uniref:DUF6884 domain-containing protein n=1 Tax=Salinibacillus aidingensis TaxID=237684 RepID=A0ABN1B0V0_9BACI